MDVFFVFLHTPIHLLKDIYFNNERYPHSCWVVFSSNCSVPSKAKTKAMRISKSTQDKLADLLRSQGYLVRYEKGNFRGGHCIVLEDKMIIINKFNPLESKINTLAEGIRQVEIDESSLSEEQVKLLKQVRK